MKIKKRTVDTGIFSVEHREWEYAGPNCGGSDEELDAGARHFSAMLEATRAITGAVMLDKAEVQAVDILKANGVERPTWPNREPPAGALPIVGDAYDLLYFVECTRQHIATGNIDGAVKNALQAGSIYQKMMVRWAEPKVVQTKRHAAQAATAAKIPEATRRNVLKRWKEEYKRLGKKVQAAVATAKHFQRSGIKVSSEAVQDWYKAAGL